MIDNHTMPQQVFELLSAAVAARISVLISGGTGAGKTTLLNALSQFINEKERLVTIEDSAELQLQQRHVVRLETRPENMEGRGEVLARQLVRNSLRMRPDRIIVGEVRGPEALDMLQAMNTGHEGSMTTIHANGTRDALTRLETMVMMTGYELPISVIRQYITSAIKLVLQIDRLKGGTRRITKVSEICGIKNGKYRLRELFGFNQHGVDDGSAFGEFYATGHVPRFLPKLKSLGFELDESIFRAGTISHEIQGFDQSFATFKLSEGS